MYQYRDVPDIKTDKYAGVLAFFFCSAVSPSHVWSEKTKATLLLISIILEILWGQYTPSDHPRQRELSDKQLALIAINPRGKKPQAHLFLVNICEDC